jgi:hypothetical protein
MITFAKRQAVEPGPKNREGGILSYLPAGL